jgi:hypothetical protein
LRRSVAERALYRLTPRILSRGTESRSPIYGGGIIAKLAPNLQEKFCAQGGSAGAVKALFSCDLRALLVPELDHVRSAVG